jgi:hypothetical protein
MAHIAFLTLFLGLVSGHQTVRLEVDQIQSVRLEVAGVPVATLSRPPWTTVIDLGAELTPRKLEAIGYDAQGTEIARASQFLNLPRPPAELEIAITSEKGRPVAARLVGRHRRHEAPKRGTLSIDGSALKLKSDFSAPLPQIDWSRPHVLSAEMRFADGQVARSDLVLESSMGGSVGSELTPVLVTKTNNAEPHALAGCFLASGAALRVNALENPDALVILVKDPDPREVTDQLRRSHPNIDRASSPLSRERHELQLAGHTKERILWPVAKWFSAAGEPTNALFEHSDDLDAAQGGMYWLITQSLTSAVDVMQPKQFTDAVAVAGVASMALPRRRAVVAILSNAPDKSQYTPAVVRRYLEDIGVPLFVWSATGPRPELADSWGKVEDISSEEGLAAATGKLEQALLQQRIAWVGVDALSALHLTTREECGLRPVARSRSNP